MNITTRNASLTDIMSTLQHQQARKLDVVASSANFGAVEGALTVKGTEAVLTADGVTQADGTYIPTAVFDEGVADRLRIPVGFLKRMREERPDLYDANVNGLLHGRRAKVSPTRGTIREAIPGDPRSFMLRLFRGDDGEPGVARAFLSNAYARMDNLDVLMATLDGIREAGVEVDIDGGDLTERRMVVRVKCPAVSALAPALLHGYRSPFTGATGADNPTVFAGFQISNSETGGGRWSITPRLVVEVCNNGMTITRDAMSRTHLGGRLEDGVVSWSADTEDTNLTLVTKQSRDAVRTFLSADYLTSTIERLEVRAGEEVAATPEAVKTITRGCSFTMEQQESVLSHFIRGGALTRGGVVHAITAAAQEQEDGDAAYSMELAATGLLI